MILTLEVLEAKHGDCLLLHYGDKDDPQTIVIDGGPAGVYANRLKPRLLQIKEALSPNAALPISMVMVSHLDDDHVNGILRLLDDAEDNDFEFKDLWVNTFDDIIGNLQLPVISALSASAAAADPGQLPIKPNTPHHISAVIASTSQGRKLRDKAHELSCSVNRKFKPFNGNPPLVRGDVSRKPVKWDDLTITVVHPDEERLTKLQKKWDDDLRKAKEKGDDSIIFASMASLDTSPFNLSSIVCLVELDGKTILLTGDGRADDIYEGLQLNKLLDAKGKLHVDILKFPHHGSSRNMTPDFLKKVTADHYVISADGNYDNPDDDLLDLFAKSVKKGTLHLTNHTGLAGKGLKKRLDDFIKELKTSNSKIKVVFGNGDPIVIDLLEKIDF
jgi:hypothetical protein